MKVATCAECKWPWWPPVVVGLMPAMLLPWADAMETKLHLFYAAVADKTLSAQN